MATANVVCVPHVSEEEENYLRMHLLVTGISQRAVRILFDKEFHPSQLDASIKKGYGTLSILKKKRVINTAQWNLLFPRGGALSETFDVTLMIILLRNLANFPEPAGGYDQLPLKTDTTPMDDLARIKHHRNQLAHFENGKMNSALFTIAWENISGAIKRLGSQDLVEECKELRTKHLDQSTVPWNLKVQFRHILDQWRKDDVNFVQTRAAKHVLEYIRKYSCVTITASSGVGKTATLRHVVLKMIGDGYNALLVTNPHDIVQFFNPNQKTLFVIDDFCGTYSINQSDLNNWEPVLRRVEVIIQNKLTKIVVACRLQVFKDGRFESLSIFKHRVCNLQSDDLCLSQTEKQSIAKLYLETNSSEIIQYCDLYNCFPLLCKLYHDSSELNITDFFRNPYSVYEAEMEQLLKKKLYTKYCVLALCVMFNNILTKELFIGEINTEIRTIIENTCEACRLDKGTSRLTLLDELYLLEHTYFKNEKGVYKTVHDKLFDFLSYYFGKQMLECLVKNSLSSFIMERFILEDEADTDQFITIVPPEYHAMYVKRMIFDWFNGEVISVFCNKNMDKPEFRQRFLAHIKTFDISFQRKLAHTCDVIIQDTVLLNCCFKGDIPFIQWCLGYSVNVNLCRNDGVSPLFVSSKKGYKEIVKLLLENKADVNKCNDGGISPLCIACHNHHVDIVQLLLENSADINKCGKTGVPPLFIACYNNYNDIVKLLLEKKANINNHKNDEVLPFIIACEKGYTNIVQLLLENKANVNKCGKTRASPLYVACQNNHADIAQLLLVNKADINKCRDTGGSPLFAACQNNHKDIVQLLLDNKADINKVVNDGKSPFSIACQNNHVDIVKLLLDNKADINVCRNDETTPLFDACQNNYVEIVKLILDNNADINKCTDDGVSPLLIACQNNHIDIVKLLLENKANTNICDSTGVSPLLIACQNNQFDVVKLLIENNADIDSCKNNKVSPLFIACQNNHVGIVKFLLDKKADINKCEDTGVSPLFIACQNNYVDIVNMLLDNKADVNQLRTDSVSPLFIACYTNNFEIVKVLLQNKADTNKCRNDGTSPLMIACYHGNTNIVQILIDNKVDINKCEDTGGSPLFAACQNNFVDIIKLLLENKAHINKSRTNGASPLLIACQKGYENIVQLLLDHKTDSKGTNNEASSLVNSCKKMLLDSEVDINKCDNGGSSPLLVACAKGYTNIVKLLLENKTDINKCRYNGVSPLFIACQNNYFDTVKLLIKNDADIDTCKDTGKSPLFIACQQGCQNVVQLLLENKADINKCMNNGASPLFIACQNNHADIVKLLLDNKADINKCMNDGASPLFIADQRNHADLVQLLLNNLASIDKGSGN